MSWKRKFSEQNQEKIDRQRELVRRYRARADNGGAKHFFR